jgi:hypothetical protein
LLSSKTRKKKKGKKLGKKNAGARRSCRDTDGDGTEYAGDTRRATFYWAEGGLTVLFR